MTDTPTPQRKVWRLPPAPTWLLVLCALYLAYTLLIDRAEPLTVGSALRLVLMYGLMSELDRRTG